MKKNWMTGAWIVMLMSALVGCKDAVLDELPNLDNDFTVEWTSEGPQYSLTLNPVNGLKVEWVRLYCSYNDVYQSWNAEETITHDFALSAQQTYTFTDAGRDFFGGDRFEGYAEVGTDLGTVRTQKLVIWAPGEGDPEIEKIEFAFMNSYGGKGALTISGHNFMTKEDHVELFSRDEHVRIDAYDGVELSEDKIVLKGVEIRTFGNHQIILRQNNHDYTLNFEVKGFKIDGLSTNRVPYGTPIYMYCSENEWKLTEENYRVCDAQLLASEPGRLTLLPYVSNPTYKPEREADMSVHDWNRDIMANCPEKLTLYLEDWEKIMEPEGLETSCQMGNLLYLQFGNSVRGYDPVSNNLYPPMAWTNEKWGSPTLMTSDGERYIYTLSGTNMADDPCYILRLDVTSGEWTELLKLEKWLTNYLLWYEGEGLLRLKDESGEGESQTYNANEGTWTPYSGKMPAVDSQMLGAYNGQYYFTYNGWVCRYPLGDPSASTKVCKPIVPIERGQRMYGNRLCYHYSLFDGLQTYMCLLYALDVDNLTDEHPMPEPLGYPGDGSVWGNGDNYYETDQYQVFMVSDWWEGRIYRKAK